MRHLLAFAVGCLYIVGMVFAAVASIPFLIYAFGAEVMGTTDAVCDFWTPLDWWASKLDG